MFSFLNVSERSTELSLKVILSQMDGHLEGLEDVFQEYRQKKLEAEKEAQRQMEEQKLFVKCVKDSLEMNRVCPMDV